MWRDALQRLRKIPPPPNTIRVKIRMRMYFAMPWICYTYLLYHRRFTTFKIYFQGKNPDPRAYHEEAETYIAANIRYLVEQQWYRHGDSSASWPYSILLFILLEANLSISANTSQPDQPSVTGSLLLHSTMWAQTVFMYNKYLSSQCSTAHQR